MVAKRMSTFSLRGAGEEGRLLPVPDIVERRPHLGVRVAAATQPPDGDEY